MKPTEKAQCIVWLIIVNLACWLFAPGAFAQGIKAFPSAGGFGAYTIGGRGGSVYHVTNLNDYAGEPEPGETHTAEPSIPGSLRYGIDNATSPVTIVFDVGGTIQLHDDLFVRKNYVTIAGQTAPGDGIALAGHGLMIGCHTDPVTNEDITQHDVIVRYLRARCSAQGGPGWDAASADRCNNVIFDHISASWSTDEGISITKSNNVTVQNCIIAEGLNRYSHSMGTLTRGRVDDLHPGGMTFAHNLWMSNRYRNPALGSGYGVETGEDTSPYTLKLDMVNNVVYNWGGQCIGVPGSEYNMYVNLVNNVFIAGPSTWNPNTVLDATNAVYDHNYPGVLYLYESGNLVDSDMKPGHNPQPTNRAVNFGTDQSQLCFEPDRYDYPNVSTQGANYAYTTVLTKAGASLVRDSTDVRLINEVGNWTGSIVSDVTSDSFPILHGGTAPTDTDQDGMPDYWENRLRLNPNNPADGSYLAGNGYTNLENYLNSLTGEVTIAPEPSGVVMLTTAMLGALACLWRRRRA
jgi:hypothetical protein